MDSTTINSWFPSGNLVKRLYCLHNTVGWYEKVYWLTNRFNNILTPTASAYLILSASALYPPLLKWIYMVGVICTVLSEMVVIPINFHWMHIPWVPQSEVLETFYQKLKRLDVSFIFRSDVRHVSSRFRWSTLYLWAVEPQHYFYRFPDRCFGQWRSCTRIHSSLN